MNIETNNRKSLTVELDGIYAKKGDFIEVTMWTSGEGVDVQISERQMFSMHFEEWEVFKKMMELIYH